MRDVEPIHLKFVDRVFPATGSMEAAPNVHPGIGAIGGEVADEG